MADPARVVVVGCGVMGRRVAQAVLDKAALQLAGAVDVSPALAGKDLGELLEPARSLGVPVRGDLSGLRADVAVLTTVSQLEKVAPQIEACARAGLDVVSTCEELSFPWSRRPDLARRIDAGAREAGVTVVGTGINPGYLMDLLPLVLTAPCLRVSSVAVRRSMNSTRRRLPFQEKIGTKLTPERFREKIADGSITGHVGLRESIGMIAAGLGWTLDECVEAPPEPVLAERETPTGLGPVPRGHVIGLRSSAFGARGGERVIRLDFEAHAAVAEGFDEIEIHGEPDIRQRISGGVHGDIGTVAVTVNTIPRVVEAPAGLLSMKDLAVPCCLPPRTMR